MSAFKCDLCGEPIDPTSTMTYQLCMGWVKKRSGGGANDVRLKKWGQRFAHDTCVDREARGVSSRQENLLA